MEFAVQLLAWQIDSMRCQIGNLELAGHLLRHCVDVFEHEIAFLSWWIQRVALKIGKQNG
jgi:hypothetical protein